MEVYVMKNSRGAGSAGLLAQHATGEMTAEMKRGLICDCVKCSLFLGGVYEATY